MPGRRHSERLTTAVLLGVYLSASLLFVVQWLGNRDGKAPIGTRLEKYTYPERAPELEGRHPRRPYLYRILVPLALKGGVALVPTEARSNWDRDLAQGSPRLARFLGHIGCRPGFVPEFLLFIALQVGFVFAFAVLLRRQLRGLYDSPGKAADLAPLLALFLAVPIYSFAAYHYDLAQLFFFTAALYTLSTRNWRWFYALVILGFLNKETMCLITVAFAATQWGKMPRRDLLLHLGAQMGIFLGLRGLILYSFDPSQPVGPRDNALRDYLLVNLGELARSDIFASFTLQMALIFSLAMILRHFWTGPVFLRRASILFIPFAAAYLKGGFWGEVRVMAELFPVAFTLFFGGVLETVGRPLTVTSEQRNPIRLPGKPEWVEYLAWLVALMALGALLLLSALVAAFGHRSILDWWGS